MLTITLKYQSKLSTQPILNIAQTIVSLGFCAVGLYLLLSEILNQDQWQTMINYPQLLVSLNHLALILLGMFILNDAIISLNSIEEHVYASFRIYQRAKIKQLILSFTSIVIGVLQAYTLTT
ncbi:hypothetical protein BFP72_01310 [Reichenbachiella sp. 5M10]|nr:hypothetical protein BFP72_01310 [Reichenbachiella sp. 5M10]